MNYALGMGAPLWIHAFGPFLFLLVVWSIFWKGLGLWHSGQRGHVWWFVAMLLLNTAGILELIYLFGIIKIHPSKLFTKHAHAQ